MKLSVRPAHAGGTCFLLISVTTVSLASFPSPQQVTQEGGLFPVASPDGAYIYYQLPGGELARIPVMSGVVDTLVDAGADAVKAITVSAAHSRLVLYQVRSDFFTFDLDTRQGSHLFTNTRAKSPAWSPLGSEIVVEVQDPDGLDMLAYPGGQSAPLSCTDSHNQPCTGNDSGAWSPDGQWLLVVGSQGIEKISRMGGTGEPVDVGGLKATKAQWSPDGDWILFGASPSGDFDHRTLWVVDARGAPFGLVELTDGAFYDYGAVWSADSREIYFNSTRSAPEQIWKVAFEVPTLAREASWGSLKSRYSNPD